MLKKNILRIACLTTIGFSTLNTLFINNTSIAAPAKFGAWITYFDEEKGIKDYQQVKNKIDSLSLFQVNYKNGEPVLHQFENKIKAKNTYLTFVNDTETIQKDSQLLKQIFNDESQINKMISLTKSQKCKGIELDFENFWDDKRLIKDYFTFTYRLYSACLKNDLKLRIILEPKALKYSTSEDYIHGPEYVVMLYNLYGKHSGPGAKATDKWIEQIVEKMKIIPGNRGVAIATGGCVWEKDNTRYLSEEDCYKLISKEQYMRDSASYDLTYEGKDTIIYVADIETINHQIELLHKNDMNNIYLWRLGGNINLKKLNTK